MKRVIYELYYERRFMDVAPTDRVRTMYGKKEDAIRTLKKKIEKWVKSKTFSTNVILKVDKSNDAENPTFYIESGYGDSIFAKVSKYTIN